MNLYTYCANNPMIYTDPSGHFWKELGDGFKYVGKRVVAAVHGGAELAVDSAKGTAGFAWNLGETLGNEIGFIGNEVGYNFGLIGAREYLNNREQRLNVISKNMGIYKELPVNMVTGVVDNFKMTFNKENFLNYWNPNTSYSDLKDYSKSAIQTGVTIYGTYKIARLNFNKLNQVPKATQVDKFKNVKVENNVEIKAKGWKVGDPINNLTKAGNEPSWSTVRTRYWKNEAMNNPGDYSVENLNLMKKGRAPFDGDLGVSMEIHHINGRNIIDPHNINNLMKVWPWQHSIIDPHRFYKGPRP